MTDLEYLKEAYLYAQKFSTDPSTNNGAILVDSTGEIKVRAANHFPKGVVETPERWERPLKYQYVEHAERNAIYTAARELDEPTKGMTMYVPWALCADCARAIIQAGIVKVVRHKNTMDKTPKHWKETIEIAETILLEGNVQMVEVSGKLDIGVIAFNGEVWEP